MSGVDKRPTIKGLEYSRDNSFNCEGPTRQGCPFYIGIEGTSLAPMLGYREASEMRKIAILD